jgi:hypothetical protein
MRLELDARSCYRRPHGPRVRRFLGRRRLARLRRRAEQLQAVEAAALSASPLPPSPEPDLQCPCGGRFTRGAPIRCPECRSMDWSEDPFAREMMVD